MNKIINQIKDKLKMSSFIVNKIYVFFLFIFISVADATLGFYYFLLSSVVYLWKTLSSKVPIDVDMEFESKTYVYKKTKNKKLKLDLWLPEQSSEKHPLVFFCHGGGWVSGFRNQPNNVSWCKYLASKGFAVVSIDYRYGFSNTMEDILLDYSDALVYVKENSKVMSIDKNNIILMGLSAGGHLSLLYSTYHTDNNNIEKMEGIKGVVAYYSPSNLNDVFISENKSILAKLATKRTLKGLPAEEEEIYEYYSPIHWVSPKMVPTLVVHGKMDTTVPFESSVNFVKKLEENKVENRFLVHKKGIHSFDTKFDDIATINILKRTTRFIKKHFET